MAQISFNPSITNAPSKSFLLETQGYVQGTFLDDPTVRMLLRSGSVSPSAATVLWGGMAIESIIPTLNANSTGAIVNIAAANGTVTGFTVNNQASNMIITPGAMVPVAGSGMDVAFFALGTNARIVVQCDSTLPAALEGGSETQQVSWDFTNQKLIAYNSGIGALAIKQVSFFNSNGKIVSYASSTASWTAGTTAIITI